MFGNEKRKKKEKKRNHAHTRVSSSSIRTVAREQAEILQARSALFFKRTLCKLHGDSVQRFSDTSGIRKFTLGHHEPAPRTRVILFP